MAAGTFVGKGRQLAQRFISRLAAPSSRRLQPACANPAAPLAWAPAEGKIKNAAERVSLCNVMGALAGAPGRGSSVSSLAASAADFLCAYYKVSGVDIVRVCF